MAYDIFSGEQSSRDWSIGGMGAGGTPLRSLAHKEAVRTKTQAMALFKLVEGEIMNNAAFGSMRARAGNLQPELETGFKNFYVAWHNWKTREIDSGKEPTKTTVNELNHWRRDNSDWTKRLTAVTAPINVEEADKKALERLQAVQQKKVTATQAAGGSSWPILAAIAALLGLGAVVAGGK